MVEVNVPQSGNACSSCGKTQRHDGCSHVVCPKRKAWSASERPYNSEYLFDGAYKITPQLGEDQ